jgi:hypothetical protein
MMKNPFAPQQIPNPYDTVKELMFKRVKSAKVNDRIFEIVQAAYENALAEENIVLSRQDRQRLLSQILSMVLDDMNKRLGNRTS